MMFRLLSLPIFVSFHNLCVLYPTCVFPQLVCPVPNLCHSTTCVSCTQLMSFHNLCVLYATCVIPQFVCPVPNLCHSITCVCCTQLVSFHNMCVLYPTCVIPQLVCPVPNFLPPLTIGNIRYNFQDQILFTKKNECPSPVFPLWQTRRIRSLIISLPDP